MGELRRDPVRNRWVVIDSERPDRDAGLKVEAQPPPPLSGPCPLCPGNELMTPPEIMAFGEPHASGIRPAGGFELPLICNLCAGLRVISIEDRRGPST